MDKVISNKKSKKKPKLSEEEKKEQIRQGLLKKKTFEDKALKTVESLLAEDVKEEFFLACLPFLNQSYYSDTVEERAITGICGYPLCSKDIREGNKRLKGKYHISLRDKKVYDLEERKNFCSNLCYKSSLFVKNQLHDSPLWLKEAEKKVEVSLFNPNVDKNSKDNTVDIGGNIKNCDIPEPCTDSQEEDEDVVDLIEEECASTLNLNSDINNEDVKDNLIPKSNIKSKNLQIKEPAISPVSKVSLALKSWFTLDSYRFVKGEENLKNALRSMKVSPEIWACTVGDKDLDEKFQASYRALVRKLNILDLQDEEAEDEDKNKMPEQYFQQMKIHSEEENMKLAAFLQGKESFVKDVTSVEIVEKDQSNSEPRFPLVDHTAQKSLRRRIVLDQLDRHLPELTTLMGISYPQIRPDLTRLVDTFSLDSENIVFQPQEWNLLGLCLLKILSQVVAPIKLCFESKESIKYINLLLLSHNISFKFLDEISDNLTLDVAQLLRTYNLENL